MDATNSSKCKGILLLQEMIQLLIDSGDVKKEPEEKAADFCWRFHQHLMGQVTIPGNQMLSDYLDRDGRSVKERLERQAKDLEAVASAKMTASRALALMRVDISHSDGMKQLLVCGGPFTDEISDAAKMAGMALKMTSGVAYENIRGAHETRGDYDYDIWDAAIFLRHVGYALGWHNLEWSREPPSTINTGILTNLPHYKVEGLTDEQKTAVMVTILDLLEKGLSQGQVKAETMAKHDIADFENLDEIIVDIDNLDLEGKEYLRKLTVEE